jgi:hypothetical protein
MKVGTPHVGAMWHALLRRRGLSDLDLLRGLSIVAGLGWAVAFILLGLHYHLQTYGDGSIFSYAVAARDAWAFHFHNISGRAFVYLFSIKPAELYVALTGDGHGGIFLYGLLFFAPPLLGLLLTYVADRSRGKIIFCFGCASTACLNPLVFGFPTEMWMAHALFWPTLALCQFAPVGLAGSAAIFALLLSLIFTHAGAAIFIVAMLMTVWLRGPRDHSFGRMVRCLAPALAIWLIVKEALPPDDYFSPVLMRAAWHVFDWNICTGRMVLLIATALTGYGVLYRLFARATPARAHLYAALAVGAALVAYWIYGHSLVHAERRYYLRTLLVVFTPIVGTVAAIIALQGLNLLHRQIPLLPACVSALQTPVAIRAVIGAIMVVTLVHAVETARFIGAWNDYRAALRTLASGTASDPAIGDARFVSSTRIARHLNRLSWWSTTPYLSVLVTPNLNPSRLVFDPEANYFWLSCDTAKANAAAVNGVPQETRRLIAKYSCLHRR